MDETLQDKITRLSNELDALEQKGITTEEDINLRNQLINERSEAEHELAQQEKIEEKVEADAVPFNLAGVSLEGVPVEVIKFGDALVKADRRRIHKDHAVEIAQLEQRHTEELTRRDEQYELLQHDFTTYKQASAEKIERFKQAHDSVVAELRVTIEGISNERDAAVNVREEAESELREVQKENERLESELADYQNAKVFGEREAQGILDVTPDESNDINAAVENVKKMYKAMEDWGSGIKAIKQDDSYEFVKRAEFEANWAPIEAPEMSGGSEPQATFLGEDQTPADNGDTQAVAEALGVVADSQFRGEIEIPDSDAAVGLAEHGTVQQGHAEIVTRSEFEALKADVEALKGKVA